MFKDLDKSPQNMALKKKLKDNIIVYAQEQLTKII